MPAVTIRTILIAFPPLGFLYPPPCIPTSGRAGGFSNPHKSKQERWHRQQRPWPQCNNGCWPLAAITNIMAWRPCQCRMGLRRLLVLHLASSKLATPRAKSWFWPTFGHSAHALNSKCESGALSPGKGWAAGCYRIESFARGTPTLPWHISASIENACANLRRFFKLKFILTNTHLA